MYKFVASLTASAALLVAAPASAHDEKPLTGQVVSVKPSSVQVKIKDGQLVTLKMDGNTRVMKAGKRMTARDLKVGQSVKALGFGDSMKDLMAIDLTILVPGKGG